MSGANVSGTKGELVDRLLAMVDQDLPSHPLWAFTFAIQIAGRVGTGFGIAPDAGRPKIIKSLRERIIRVIDAGVAEDFLVRSLRRELDEWVRSRQDLEQHDQDARDLRETLQQLRDDPEFRAEWHRANDSDKGSARTDDELAADVEAFLNNSELAQPAAVEDATERWSELQEWERLTSEHLAEQVVEAWEKERRRRLLG